MSHGVSRTRSRGHFPINFTDTNSRKDNKLENNNCSVKEKAKHGRNSARPLFQFYTSKEKDSKSCPLLLILASLLGSNRFAGVMFSTFML